MSARREEERIRVGISSCLLGGAVRWDGGHKRDRYLTDVLGDHFEWVPVCPEVELGMGIPRPPVRLEGDTLAPRMVDPKSGVDHTRAMSAFAARRARSLGAEELCGYVLKSGSPSCGMERVRVHSAGGMPRKRGRGLYARALIERFPLLPVEEEGRLHDPRLRENWIERVFAYRRLRTLLAGRLRVRDLVAFHTAHKLQLLAHSERHYRSLGRLVARAKGVPLAELRSRYEHGFMEGLAHMATPRRHQNVLHHALGHLRGLVDRATARELHDLIEEYGRGRLPLVVPITMLRHYVRRQGVAYLAGQVYLDPHPRELMLRNHV